MLQKQYEETGRQLSKWKEQCEHKDKVLSVIAHDLKSPLSSLGSLLGLLDADGGVPAEYQQVVELLKIQLGSVSELLDNLLRWAALSSRTEDEHFCSSADVSQLIRQSLLLLSSAAADKGIILLDQVPPGQQAYVNADEIAVTIRNLIHNAIKFTRSGGLVRISARSEDNWLLIEVADNGVGISEAQLDKILNAGYNSSFGTNGEKGCGLGLVLCREYVAANHGCMEVHSRLNEGTTVRIALPMSGGRKCAKEEQSGAGSHV